MIQDSFPDKRQCQIVGKNDEYIVFTRLGRSISVWANNYEYKGLLIDNTALNAGDVVIDKQDKYLVKSVRQTLFSTQGQMVLTNCEIDIVRPVKSYVNGTFTGYSESPIGTQIVALQETITGKMQILEPGLLSTTTKRFLIPANAIQPLDRIKLVENYEVDVLDFTSFPGLISVQCSLDKRK